MRDHHNLSPKGKTIKKNKKLRIWGEKIRNVWGTLTSGQVRKGGKIFPKEMAVTGLVHTTNERGGKRRGDRERGGVEGKEGSRSGSH